MRLGGVMPARPSPPPAPGAEPRWAAGAAAEAGIVVLAIPLHKFATLDPSLVAGKIVVDLGSGCRGLLPGGLGVAGPRLGVASRARGWAEAGPRARRAVGPDLARAPGRRGQLWDASASARAGPVSGLPAADDDAG